MNKNERGNITINTANELPKEFGMGLLETVYEVFFAH